MLVTIEHGAVLEIRLERPPANALVPELVLALREALAAAFAGRRGALVLSGAPGMFSAGLDVPRFLTLERRALGRAWRDFFALMHDLVSAPIPVAAAITGHAPAGGCVLALCCDWRILATGRSRIGLNEVQVGVRMPSPILAVARHVVGRRQAERMCTQATLFGPEDALRIGLVDALEAPGEVVPAALAWCQAMLALPPETLRRTRALARRELAKVLEHIEEESLEQFLDEWYSSESQAALTALVERLRK